MMYSLFFIFNLAKRKLNKQYYKDPRNIFVKRCINVDLLAHGIYPVSFY